MACAEVDLITPDGHHERRDRSSNHNYQLLFQCSGQTVKACRGWTAIVVGFMQCTCGCSRSHTSSGILPVIRVVEQLRQKETQAYSGYLLLSCCQFGFKHSDGTSYLCHQLPAVPLAVCPSALNGTDEIQSSLAIVTSAFSKLGAAALLDSLARICFLPSVQLAPFMLHVHHTQEGHAAALNVLTEATRQNQAQGLHQWRLPSCSSEVTLFLAHQAFVVLYFDSCSPLDKWNSCSEAGAST